MDRQEQIIIYDTEDGQTHIDVHVEEQTLWLTQKQMRELFDKDPDTIGLHLKNIYQSRELNKKATTGKYSVVQLEGKRKVKSLIWETMLGGLIWLTF